MGVMFDVDFAEMFAKKRSVDVNGELSGVSRMQTQE
jgi:hypothetical protein